MGRHGRGQGGARPQLLKVASRLKFCFCSKGSFSLPWRRVTDTRGPEEGEWGWEEEPRGPFLRSRAGQDGRHGAGNVR